MDSDHTSYHARTVEIGVLAAAFLTPLIILPRCHTYDPFYLKLIFFELLMVVLLAVWALECAAQNRLVWTRTPLDLPIAAFLLWNLLSVLWSRYDYAALNQLGKYLCVAALYFLTVSHFREWRQIRRLLIAIFASAAVACLYGVMQFFGYDWFVWNSGDVRPISSLGNSTFFAAHLVLLLPLALNVFLLKGKVERGTGNGEGTSPDPRLAASLSPRASRFSPLLWGGLVALMYFCLLTTYTRAAWLSLLVMAVVDLALLWRYARGGGRTRSLPAHRWHAAGLVLLLVALTAAVAWRGPYPLGKRMASSFQLDMSNVQRIMIWKAAGKMFLAHPLLGVGSGAFFQECSRYLNPEFYNIGRASWVAHAHNELLEQAAETGVIGLGTFLGLLLAFAAMSLRTVARAPERRSRYLAAGALCGMFAFLGQNLAGVSMRFPTGAVYFWLFLALGAAVASIGQGREVASEETAEGATDSARPSARASQVVLAFLLLGVVGVVGREIINRQLSDLQLGAAIANREAHRYPEAYQEIQAALVLNPYSLLAYSTLGSLGVDTRNYEQALVAFQALQSLDAEYPMMYRGLGQAYLGLHRYPEALAALEQDTKFEHSPVSLSTLTRAYVEAGELDKALVTINEAVRIVEEGRPWLHMTPAEVYLLRALVLGQMALKGQPGQREAALRDLARAEQLDPHSPRPHLVAGDLYRAARDYPQAIAEYEKGLALSPEAPQPYVLLGMTYEARGDFARAVESYQAALARQPGDPFVQQKLKEAEARHSR